MFRKKDTETETPASGEGGFRRPGGDAAKPGVQPDLRRKVELSGSATGARPLPRRPAGRPSRPSPTVTASA